MASERPTATVDDIKASVMSLKLGRTSPSIRKATSSQSLHSELGGKGGEGGFLHSELGGREGGSCTVS